MSKYSKPTPYMTEVDHALKRLYPLELLEPCRTVDIEFLPVACLLKMEIPEAQVLVRQHNGRHWVAEWDDDEGFKYWLVYGEPCDNFKSEDIIRKWPTAEVALLSCRKATVKP